MAEFKKQSSFKQKFAKNKKTNITMIILIVIILLLLCTTVPAHRLPGMKFVFGIMGKQYYSDSELSLASILYGGARGRPHYSAAMRSGSGYYDENGNFVYTGYSDTILGRNLSAITPLTYEDIKQRRLLNSQTMENQMARDGDNFAGIYGTYQEHRDGKKFTPDYNFDPNQAISPDTLPSDIPLFQEPLEGGPAVSTLMKPVRGSGVTASYKPEGGENIIGAAKSVGYAAKGRLRGFMDPKGWYRRGRSPISGLQDDGEDSLGQMGNAWRYSKAGDLSKQFESKKVLAQAAFDASEMLDEVILNREENPTILDLESANSDKNLIAQNRKKNEECQKAIKDNQKAISQALSDMTAASERASRISIDCCMWTSSSEGDWNRAFQDYQDACKKYNELQGKVAAICGTLKGYKIKEGSCDKLKTSSGGYGKLDGCGNVFEWVLGSLTCITGTDKTKSGKKNITDEKNLDTLLTTVEKQE
ncbi:hypothetical protein Dip510_001979 [Elusimicrobium posterum]|uniref:hypothetical protein n=1 Tax=Elusimicrobium posterum TaxID=3116653 RepID=UPI003C786604